MPRLHAARVRKCVRASWALVAGLACVGAIPAQEPIQVAADDLRGAIDFHVHSGPDAVSRSLDDIEVARLARSRGLAAIVLKNHFTQTADRAALAERLAPGLKCFGGIALNRAVGGLNEEAVRRMAAFTGGRGKVVWLPTFDAENHVRFFKETRPAVPVVRDGRPVPEAAPIFKLCAERNLVLQTGHSSAEECLILIRAAREAGVKQILVTHAMSDPIGMTAAQMKEAARLGAKLECVWLTNLNGPNSHLASQRHWKRITTAEYAKAIREVGPEHFVLSSDLGQYLNPVHTDGLLEFYRGLKQEGISAAAIDRMARHNPAELLGLPAAPPREDSTAKPAHPGRDVGQR